MLGNAYEWCFEEYEGYASETGKVIEDSPSITPVEATGRRVLRGGAFIDRPMLVRSASR